jgi:hypothetical protein
LSVHPIRKPFGDLDVTVAGLTQGPSYDHVRSGPVVICHEQSLPFQQPPTPDQLICDIEDIHVTEKLSGVWVMDAC